MLASCQLPIPTSRKLILEVIVWHGLNPMTGLLHEGFDAWVSYLCFPHHPEMG